MKINFTNTLEEEVLRNTLDNDNRNKSIAPNLFFSLMWTLLSYLMYLGFGIIAAIIFFILGVIYIALIKRHMSEFIKKFIIKKQKMYSQNKHIKLSDENLLINVSDLEFCEPLNRIEKYIVYDDKIYIRLLDTESLIIPKRAFCDEQNEFYEFIEIIKKNSEDKSTVEDIDNIKKERLQKSFDILIDESYKSLRAIKYIFSILSVVFAFMISIVVVGELSLSGISALIVPLVFIGITMVLSPRIYNKVIPSISQSIKLNIFYEIQNKLVIKEDGIHSKILNKDYFISWNDIEVYRILVHNVFLKTSTDKIIPIYFNDNGEKDKIINLLKINNVKEAHKKDFELSKLLKGRDDYEKKN